MTKMKRPQMKRPSMGPPTVGGGFSRTKGGKAPSIGKLFKKWFKISETEFKKIRITTRKEQPMPVQLKRMKVKALARRDIPLQRVSSSWIKEIGYHAHDKLGVMTTLPKGSYGSRGYIIMVWI